ncbi:MAG TPA: MFS transporter [Casimicrobiaceae bacterium]|nr:MFS transporter [Casimicrobiaceae bacterium]
MKLRPDTTITAADLQRGQRALVRDAAWASITGSLYGGVVLVAFALALGAGPFVIGMLAAIPFIGQAAQLPAIALIERVRQRRKITVLSVTVSRVLILLLALLPLMSVVEGRLTLLLVAQLTITILGSLAGCALNSWLHQLLPSSGLGAFFAKRLFWGTACACIGTLAAGLLVDLWPYGEKLQAYSVTFAAAGVAGFVSTWFLTRVPEPVMTQAGPPASVISKIAAPFRDANFRRVLRYILAWNAATNLAAPFLAVYLIQQMHFSLGTVTTLWVTSQVANAVVLYIWGRLSDRLSNKAVLRVALPVYFACMLGLAFAAIPHARDVALPLLYVVHIAMGAAAGGIGLATGNMSLKLAPQGQGTAYLAATSLVASVTGGIAPLIGGALAHLFEAGAFSVIVRWAWSGAEGEATVIGFTRYQFLFVISAALGLYVLHRLSRIREGEEISEHVVIQQFALEAIRTVNQLSTVAGLLGNLFTFGRLIERRLHARRSAVDGNADANAAGADALRRAGAADDINPSSTPRPSGTR